MRHTVLKLIQVCILIIHAESAVTYGPNTDDTWTRTSLIGFRLDISGFGLSNADTIRLVSPDSTCTADSGDPMGVERSIQWNCPDIDSGCTNMQATPAVNIPVEVKSYDCVRFDDLNNCLGDSVYITSIETLSTGEIHITFDGESGLSDGDYIRFDSGGLVCGSDCVSSNLDLLLSGPDSLVTDDFIIGHRLHAGSDTFYIQIDAFAVLSPPPQFVLQTPIGWYRTSLISTRIELMGLTDRVGVRVCWNGGGASLGYTTEVGLLTIVNQDLMGGLSGIYPTNADAVTRQDSLMVIAFTTADSPQYATDSAYSHKVTLHFTSVDNFRVLNLDGSALASSYDVSVCFEIFAEITTPMPIGCFVRVAVGVGIWIDVVFDEGNGFVAKTQYQFVVNTFRNVDAISTVENFSCCASKTCGGDTDIAWVRGCEYVVVSLYTNAASFNPIEVANLQFHDSIGRSFTPDLSLPFLGSVEIIGGVSDVLELSQGDSLVFRLTGGDGVNTGSITAGSVLKFFLFPLTVWRFGNACIAQISESSISGSGGYLSEIDVCVGVPVVPGSYTNTIEIVLPSNLPSINHDDWIQLEISGGMVPLGGFFEVRFGVQIAQSSPWSRRYIETVGSTVWKHPNIGRSIFRILAETAVTDSSFLGDTARELLVQTMTRISVPPGGTMMFTLPIGFTCISVEPMNNSLDDETIWTTSGDNTCTLTVQKGIFGFAYLMWKLVVDYPSGNPLQIIDPANVWSMTITDDAGYSHTAVSTGGTGWCPSISILGSLTDAAVLPLDSTLAGSGEQIYALKLRVQQSVVGGTLRVDFPPEYILPSLCVSTDLLDYVYYTHGYSVEPVFRIPELVSECLMESTDEYTRVVIAFAGTLGADTRYGVGIRLQAPDTLIQPGHVQVRTIDRFGNLVDGSKDLWSPTLFSNQVGLDVVYSDALLPGTLIDVTLSFTFVITDEDSSIVVSAPSGFLLNLCSIQTASGTWTVVDSGVDNVMILTPTANWSGTAFEFIILGATVPDRVASWPFVWSLDVGTRLHAVNVASEFPQILSLVNARVVPGSTVSGATHLVLFEVQLVSPIYPGGDLVLSVPEELLFSTNCQILPHLDAITNTNGWTCFYVSDQITIGMPIGALPGLYSWFIEATNPGEPSASLPMTGDAGSACLESFCFEFSAPVDAPLVVFGFGFVAELLAAGFVAKFQTDARPMYVNELVLYWSPSGEADSLRISAPIGFEFALNCTLDIVIGDVFVDGRPWNNLEYTRVPFDVVSCACVANRREDVQIVFTQPLPAVSPDTSYAIRLRVRNAPNLHQYRSQWSLLSGDSEGATWESEPLWTFNDVIVVSSALGQGQMTFVSFEFEPYHTIPVGGVLIITNSESSCSGSGCSENSFLVVLESEWLAGERSTISNKWTNAQVGGVWTIQSFFTSLPLDESKVNSAELVLAPAYFTVGDPYMYANMTVNITFIFASPVVVLAGDLIVFKAPLGFDFTYTAPGVETCKPLVWQPVGGVVTGTISAIATCVGRLVTIVPTSDIPANLVFGFTLPGINPKETPIDNLFVVSMSGELLVSGSYSGWDIVPLLARVEIFNTGPNYAISSITTIVVKLTTTSVCNGVWVEFPVGFDFQQAMIETDQFDEWEVFSDNSVRVFGYPLLAGSEIELQIRNAKTGPVPGEVYLNVTSWIDFVTLVDARVDFFAFSLSEKLDVFDQKLFNSALLEVAPNDDVAQFYIPQTLENCLATFNFTFDVLAVSVGSFFKIESEFFLLLPHNVTVSSIRNVSTVYHTEFVRRYLPLESVMVRSNSSVLTFRIQNQMETNIDWMLEFRVIAPSSTSRSLSNFLFEIYPPGPSDAFNKTNAIPTHTNDYTTTGFMSANPVLFKMSVPRSPPSARISLNVIMHEIANAEKGVLTYSLILIAPTGFEFDSDCLLNSGTAGASLCVPGAVYSGGRNSAYIAFQNGLQWGNSFEISTITPVVMEGVNEWVVVANGLAGVEIAWGRLSDVFTIVPMSSVAVTYTRMGGSRSQVGFVFENKVIVDNGGKIRVYFPTGFQFDCTTFSKVTLPFYTDNWNQICLLNFADVSRTTITVNSDSFDILLPHDLVPGLFSFTMEAKTPLITPTNNQFTLVLLAPETKQVVDAYVGYTGNTLSSEIHVELVSGMAGFEWSPSVVARGAKLQLEIFFNVLSQISPSDSTGKIPFQYIAVFFPEGFINALIVDDEVFSGSSPNLFTHVDVAAPNRLLLTVDNSKRISKQTYNIQFPVVVPNSIPDINIWYLAFCSDVCNFTNDTTVIENLPIGGFLLGEEHPYTRTFVATSAGDVYGITSAYLIVVLLVTQFLCIY